MRSIATLLLVSIVTASVAGDCEKHFFNFGQILRGYNGIKGNPNSIEQTDPGFRNPIFEAVYLNDTTPDGKYCVPSGITFHNCESSCDISGQTNAQQTYGEKSYRMELGGKVKGLLETGTIVSFGASEEFRHVSSRTEQSFFLQSESTCCSYTTTISLYDMGHKLNFTDGFKRALLSLPVDYEEADIEKYYTFVNEFGTHYVKQGTMGARYGIQAEVDRSTFSKETTTASDLDGSASEIELESIELYINGNHSSTFVDTKTNFQVRVFSRGARPPSTKGGLDWKEAMNNEHPVPIGLDVGALWELVELEHFPEIMEIEGMAERIRTVKDNLKQFINTDYCKVLLHAGLVHTCAPAPKDLGPTHLTNWCHSKGHSPNSEGHDHRTAPGHVCTEAVESFQFRNQVYHNFLKLVNYGLMDVKYKCPEKDGFEPSESPWPSGLDGGHARWQDIHTCDQGFESLRLWTWNDHLAVDPLGVTDVELKCVNSTKVVHALNSHEPDSGSTNMGEGTRDPPCACGFDEEIVGVNTYIGHDIGITDIQLICRLSSFRH